MTTRESSLPTRHRRRQTKPSIGNAILGGVGELFITVGVLLGLFVAWQLWWTDVKAMAEQNTLTQSVEEQFDDSPPQVGEVRTDTPPTLAEIPLDESTFALLWVPRWDSGSDPYRRTISQGVDRATVLDTLGIGHYPDTAMPGEVGNFAVAGHRQSHGKPFYNVTQLEVGDPIVVETADAWYVYKVTETKIVLPTEVEVVAPNPSDPAAPADVASITLTTCHPLFSTKERFIVHGELDHWIPRDSGRPAEIMAAS